MQPGKCGRKNAFPALPQDEKNGGIVMNTVQRTKGIRKAVRLLLRQPVQKHVTAGDRACARLMREARSFRRNAGPSDSAILAWARFDLRREALFGFWDVKPLGSW